MQNQSELQIDVSFDARPTGVVATLTIANARRLNSLNSELMDQFLEAISTLSATPHLRALILTGAGESAFIGGADIKEMAAIRSTDAARAFISRVHDCCDAIRSVPVPTIARIQGYTFGAGLEIAASCDLRVASDQAIFGMPEVKLGIPSVVEAALLPQLVGWGRARQILLLGETFDAAQALEWKFVESVVSAEDLHNAVEIWVSQVLTSQPRAVRLQKTLIRAWEDLPLRAAIQAGINSFESAFETKEPEQAMRLFLAAQEERKEKQRRVNG